MMLILLQMATMAFADEPAALSLSVDYTAAGEAATFQMDGVPGSTVWLLGGMERVSLTPTRGCTDITMGVLPNRRIRLTADADGSATVDGNLPALLAGNTLYVQALAFDAAASSCVVSEVVSLTL